MPLNKEQKTKVIEGLKEAIAEQKAMVFVNFSGIKAQEIRDLRKKLKQVGAKLIVVKKTLAKIAFSSCKINLPEQGAQNELAIIFGFEDQIQPAKVAYDFSRAQEKLRLVGGYLTEDKNYQFLSDEEMIALAQLLGRSELLARFVRVISSPMSNFINVQTANIKGLMRVLSLINNQ